MTKTVTERPGGLVRTLTEAERAAEAAAELELKAAAARAAADQARSAAEAERRAVLLAWAAETMATGEGDRDQAMRAADDARAAFRLAAAERPNEAPGLWLAWADARTAQWGVERRLERAQEIRGEQVARVVKDLSFDFVGDLNEAMRLAAMARWGARDRALRAELEGVREGRADG